GMTLPSCQNIISRRVNHSGTVAPQQRHQAPPFSFLQVLCSCQLEKCGCQVNQAYHVVYGSLSGNAWPANGQRYITDIFLDTCLGVEKSHASIRGDHNKRNVEYSALFQNLQHAVELLIEPRNL